MEGNIWNYLKVMNSEDRMDEIGSWILDLRC